MGVKSGDLGGQARFLLVAEKPILGELINNKSSAHVQIHIPFDCRLDEGEWSNGVRLVSTINVGAHAHEHATVFKSLLHELGQFLHLVRCKSQHHLHLILNGEHLFLDPSKRDKMYL